MPKFEEARYALQRVRDITLRKYRKTRDDWRTERHLRKSRAIARSGETRPLRSFFSKLGRQASGPRPESERTTLTTTTPPASAADHQCAPSPAPLTGKPPRPSSPAPSTGEPPLPRFRRRISLPNCPHVDSPWLQACSPDCEKVRPSEPPPDRSYLQHPPPCQDRHARKNAWIYALHEKALRMEEVKKRLQAAGATWLLQHGTIIMPQKPRTPQQPQQQQPHQSVVHTVLKRTYSFLPSNMKADQTNKYGICRSEHCEAPWCRHWREWAYQVEALKMMEYIANWVAADLFNTLVPAYVTDPQIQPSLEAWAEAQAQKQAQNNAAKSVQPREQQDWTAGPRLKRKRGVEDLRGLAKRHQTWNPGTDKAPMSDGASRAIGRHVRSVSI